MAQREDTMDRPPRRRTGSQARAARIRQQRKNDNRTVMFVLSVCAAVILVAGMLVGRAVFAPRPSKVLDKEYQKRFDKAQKLKDDGDYAGAITELDTIGSDWSSYSKAKKEKKEVRKLFKEDLFSQLEVLTYSSSVVKGTEGTPEGEESGDENITVEEAGQDDSQTGMDAVTEDQIKLLLNAAPYLNGDSDYEDKLLELCGLREPIVTGSETTQGDDADRSGEDTSGDQDSDDSQNTDRSASGEDSSRQVPYNFDDDSTITQ